ncbi:MAG: hypothetical protein AAGH46_07920 [Bacteroidota bacterium]
MENAEHHIHLKYYIFYDDDVGTQIIHVLCAKAQYGVEVRVIYDVVGSSISRRNKRRMTNSGDSHAPFMPVLFSRLASKMNYRDHRKIVIDGKIGYVGGINISDYYINSGKHDYWRDTHLRIEGEAVKPLQILFFTTWDFVKGKNIKLSEDYFLDLQTINMAGVRAVANGTDTDWPFIMEAIFASISAARKYIYITTPYFIPNE